MEAAVVQQLLALPQAQWLNDDSTAWRLWHATYKTVTPRIIDDVVKKAPPPTNYSARIEHLKYLALAWRGTHRLAGKN